MRTFIAIDIPENIKDSIELYVSPLKGERAKITWVKSGNVHITLKFLGEIPEEKVPEIYKCLEKCVKGLKPFEVEITGAGGFPDMRRPRIIWVGLKKGTDELKKLANSIDDELSNLDFEKEKRGFKPHLTIGRVKYINDISGFIDKMSRLKFEGGTFTADEIFIIKSELKPTGAVYTKLESIKF